MEYNKILLKRKKINPAVAHQNSSLHQWNIHFHYCIAKLLQI